MSTSEHPGPPTSSATEITLVSGEHHYVEGDLEAVEHAILDAARGSIMQLAWFVEVRTREALAVNPRFVALLRAARGPDGGD